MTVSPPTLYWYQLDVGTLAPNYWGQLDTCVRDLCTANSVTLPTAPWYNPIGGTLNNVWILQIDTAVRALCTALSVTAPTGSPVNLIAGTETANYYASLDATVRTLCDAGYTASAVHFASGANLSIASLTATDNENFSSVFWIRMAAYPSGGDGFIFTNPNDFTNAVWARQTSGKIRCELDKADFSGNVAAESGSPPSLNTWTCVMISGIGNTSPKKLKIYFGDTDIGGAVTDFGDAFSMSFNGLPWILGTDGSGSDFTGDLAEVRVMPGTSLLDGSGNIPLATRRLFIDGSGKPVDPAVATASLGTPCILFSGDSTGFVTNQGNGGAFTLSGSLTNASSSPSD